MYAYSMGNSRAWERPGCGAGFREDLRDQWRAAMSGKRGRHGDMHGFGPWAMFGGGAQWGPPWAGGQRGPWRGPKARRGDVRAAILSVLAESPMNGYQIIQEINERSGGVWKPSPGSVYPTLQQLEDEGLVHADEVSGRRTFDLTDEGRAYVDSHREEVDAPWEAMTAAADESDENGLRPLVGQVASVMWQIMATGSQEQQERARQAMSDLRRRLYTILAEDDPEEGERR